MLKCLKYRNKRMYYYFQKEDYRRTNLYLHGCFIYVHLLGFVFFETEKPSLLLPYTDVQKHVCNNSEMSFSILTTNKIYLPQTSMD